MFDVATSRSETNIKNMVSNLNFSSEKDKSRYELKVKTGFQITIQN